MYFLNEKEEKVIGKFLNSTNSIQGKELILIWNDGSQACAVYDSYIEDELDFETISKLIEISCISNRSFGFCFQLFSINCFNSMLSISSINCGRFPFAIASEIFHANGYDSLGNGSENVIVSNIVIAKE